MRNNFLNLKSVLLALLFAGLAVILCIFGVTNGALFAITKGEPSESLEAFSSELAIGDTQEAIGYTTFGSWPVSLDSEADENTVTLFNAVAESFSFTPNAKAEKKGVYATINSTATYLNLNKFKELLKDKVEQEIIGTLDDMSFREAYNSDGTIKEEIVEKGYTKGLKKAVLAANECYDSVDTDIHFVYSGGKWRITNEGNIISILNGGTDSFNTFIMNLKSDVVGDKMNIKKEYKIDKDATSAPKPNKHNFGSTTNPSEVMDIISSAAFLLGDEEFKFDPNANFFPGSEIKYYLDETILVVTWKEVIENVCCSFSEVKVADASQFRRCLSGGSYASGVLQYPTNMANDSNAVMAMSADFYAFRTLGITAYKNELYRFEGDSLDTCYIDYDGNMLFSSPGQFGSEAEAKQFIKDNNVNFALSFGPVLVRDGQKEDNSAGYPIGEIDSTYSRSCLAQVDDLHYLCMTINYEGAYQVTATLDKEANIILSKGVKQAYALDGGQTSTMIMEGKVYNYIDWGAERTMSDIIYFATAIPDVEGE